MFRFSHTISSGISSCFRLLLLVESWDIVVCSYRTAETPQEKTKKYFETRDAAYSLRELVTSFSLFYFMSHIISETSHMKFSSQVYTRGELKKMLFWCECLQSIVSLWAHVLAVRIYRKKWKFNVPDHRYSTQSRSLDEDVAGIKLRYFPHSITLKFSSCLNNRQGWSSLFSLFTAREYSLNDDWFWAICDCFLL